MDKTKEILEREGIEEFEQDIRMMTKRELRRHFRFKTNRRLNPTKLIKNLIWQAFGSIRSGKMEPIEGNIRSFWYISVKPVLSRLGLDVSGRRYTEKLYDAFVRLTASCRLFRYADFGFVDERIYHRRIGQANGNLVLFIEKDGMFSILRSIAEKYDTTAITLGGFPSYLTTEFLVRSMARQGCLRGPIQLFGLADYDPSGWWIEREFRQQLGAYGVEIGSASSVMKPDLLPPELIEIYKYELKATPRLAGWLEATGGIAGEAYGLEADALGGSRVREAFGKIIQPHLRDSFGALAGDLSAEREQWLSWLKRDAAYLAE